MELSKRQNKNSSVISFKGVYSQATNILAKGASKVINTTPIQNFAKNSDKKSLTIVCKDKMAIRFNNLKLYKAELFTKKYIDTKILPTS